MSKFPFFISILCILIYKAISHFANAPWLALLIFLIPITLLATNFAFRKHLKHKNCFSKPWNKFLETKKASVDTEIAAELLFDKLIEDAINSDYTLIDQSKSSLELLYSTSVNFWTWGENIYIKIDPINNTSSKITFTSIVLYGSYSWKRNQSNFDKFFIEFENSLTI